MIKTSLMDVRTAYAAFTRIFEETPLKQDAAWSLSRMLSKLKTRVRDLETAQLKLYKDAGGTIAGNGVTMPTLSEREKTETLADWEARREAYRQKMNGLSDEVQALNDREVEIDIEPIKVSLLPKKRKNEKGEEVDIEYRGTDLAACGPFLIE